MSEIWNNEDFLFFAKDKKKKKDKQPKVDPVHFFTDNPQGPWGNVQENAKSFGKCVECGAHDLGVKSPENHELCSNCRHSPEIVEKHSNECDFCCEKAPAGQKYCSEHTIPCKTCGQTIDDIGEDDNTTHIDPDELTVERCAHHRARCESCDNPILDKEGLENDSPYCEDCRPHCEECGDEIEDASEYSNPDVFKYCQDCRKSCRDCYNEIKDKDDYPNSEQCEDCRPNCEECGEPIEDENEDESFFCEHHRNYCQDCDRAISDQEDYPESNYCENHRHYCENCNDPIDDQVDYPDSDYCERHRVECKECGKEIDDTYDFPDTEHCSEHRHICKEPSESPHEIDDVGTMDYDEASTKHDNLGNPLSDYCDDHRHRCKFCNSNVGDYEQEKEKSDNESEPYLSPGKMKTYTTNPLDTSSIRHLDIFNPEYTENNQNEGYTMCKSCRNYINDWNL